MKQVRLLTILVCMGICALNSMERAHALETGITDIENVLVARGLVPEKRSLYATQGAFENALHLTFPASSEKASTVDFSFVLALSLDSADINKETAMELCAMAQEQGLPAPLRVAFLPDTESRLPPEFISRSNLGLRDLLSLYERGERVILLYLDLDSPFHEPRIEHGSRESICALEILQPMVSVFLKNKRPPQVAVPYNELYRLKLVQGPETLRIAHAAGFNALALDSSHITLRKSLEATQCAQLLYDYFDSIQSLPETFDTRYSFLPLLIMAVPSSSAISIIWFFLLTAIISGALIFVSISHRHLLLLRARAFFRRLWVPLLMGLLLWLCLQAATLILYIAGNIFSSTAIQSDLAIALLRVGTAVCLYYLLSPLFKLLPFPRQGLFYAEIATLLVIIGTLLAAFLDFSFVPVFLFSLSLCLLSVLSRSRGFCLILVGFSVLPILGGLASAYGSGDSTAADLVQNAGPLTDMLISFLCLPFIVLLRRISSLKRKLGKERSDKVSIPVRTVAFVMTLIAFLFQVYTVVSSNTHVQKLDIIHKKISTPDSPIGTKTEGLFISSRRFLDRQILNISWKLEQAPARLDLFLRSETAIRIYEAPVPTSTSSNGNVANLLLAENPPKEHSLELILPYNLSIDVTMQALYPDSQNNTLLVLSDSIPALLQK